jgi:hypothetical protein
MHLLYNRRCHTAPRSIAAARVVQDEAPAVLVCGQNGTAKHRMIRMMTSTKARLSLGSSKDHLPLQLKAAMRVAQDEAAALLVCRQNGTSSKALHDDKNTSKIVCMGRNQDIWRTHCHSQHTPQPAHSRAQPFGELHTHCLPLGGCNIWGTCT